MKILKKRSAGRKRVGLPPGTLFNEEGKGRESFYELFEFDEKGYKEESGKGLPDLEIFDRAGEKNSVVWLNIVGVGDGSLLSRLGEKLGVHPVMLEDIQNTVQRPKCEEFGGLAFMVFRMLRRGAASGDPTAAGETASTTGGIESEQISLLLGENFVISFQERPGDVFDPIRSRIRKGRGKVGQSGPDYLAYALIDMVVDTYFLLLEDIEGELEDLEDLLDERRTEEIPNRLRRAKGDLINVRRAVRPLREVVEVLLKGELALFGEAITPYLRDLNDHIYRVIDTVEMLKEMQSIIGGSYQAAVSNDMNSIMKVLTIIATIFIPLTFVAGVYGMNFEHMPELAVPWAYPLVLGIMGVIVIGMLLFFRKRGWL